jgi:hypothetical protein
MGGRMTKYIIENAPLLIINFFLLGILIGIKFEEKYGKGNL